MAERGKGLRESTAVPAAGRVTPRLEQLLLACGGYVVAPLLALIVRSSPGDGEFLVFGIAGAFFGTGSTR